MNKTRTVIYVLSNLAIAAAGTVAAILLTSCSTLRPSPCVGAAAAMERKGYEVIECWSDQEPDTYERVERCMVWNKEGKVVVKTVFARHCGL